MTTVNGFVKISPEEAAAMIPHGATVAFSGFASAGAAKAVPRALAARACELHRRGEPFRVGVLTGSSSGETIDELLADANAISWRAPYQSSSRLRSRINGEEVEYVDMHVSGLPRTILSGFFGKLDVAVVEATDVTPDGRVYLTSSIGASPTYLQTAEKVVIELNHYHSKRLPEMADIAVLASPPTGALLQIHDSMTKIGHPYALVDPRKIVGVVETNEPNHVTRCAPADALSEKMAGHILKFLMKEMRSGHIPPGFLPVQAGVGQICDGIMRFLGNHPDMPYFRMYSLVLQDSFVELMKSGKLLGMSATSLTLTPEVLNEVYSNMDFFVPRIVLRPQDISNSAEVIRRLGLIAMNAAIEVDIYGNVNNSHVYGTDVVNGIGGSGEFTRNSYISIIVCPSIAKGGKISTIVPMCPHIDNNEHSVQIVVTEQGLADLRGLGPMQRARTIIENCAHPAYRDYLYKYIERSRVGHIRHDLDTCYELHQNLMTRGAMLPDLDLSAISGRGAVSKSGRGE
ncbi:MAG: succinate CoA transferase [Acidobacteriota bacterium]